MFGRTQRFRPDLGRLQRFYAALIGNLSPSAENFQVQLARCLKGLAPEQVLDAGCGKGTFSIYLAQRFPKAQVVGVDLCPDMHSLASNIAVCEQVKARAGIDNVEFRQLDLHELEDPETYDLIVSIHVLEHIENNELVIDRMIRALRPGGALHIQMPRDDDHAAQQDCEELAEWSEEEHIGKEYDPEEMQALLESKGLEVTVCKTDGGWMHGWACRYGESLRFRKKTIRLALLWPLLKTMIRLGGRFLDNGKGNTVVLAKKAR